MVIEIIVMYPIQHRPYRPGIDNLLVLLIGGISIAMPIVLSVTMPIGLYRSSQQGAITKRMTTIEEMSGMDVVCINKTRTLTLNKLTIDKNLIKVFTKGVDVDTVVLMSAQASPTENQGAIDAAIVGMLVDPKVEEKNVKRLTEENAHMKDLLHKEEAQKEADAGARCGAQDREPIAENKILTFY